MLDYIQDARFWFNLIFMIFNLSWEYTFPCVFLRRESSWKISLPLTVLRGRKKEHSLNACDRVISGRDVWNLSPAQFATGFPLTGKFQKFHSHVKERFLMRIFRYYPAPSPITLTVRETRFSATAPRRVPRGSTRNGWSFNPSRLYTGISRG